MTETPSDDAPTGGPEGHDAGGTYAPRDQSEAARRSESRIDQHADKSDPAYTRDKPDYGQRDPSGSDNEG
jgi:hypothetical protein